MGGWTGRWVDGWVGVWVCGWMKGQSWHVGDQGVNYEALLQAHRWRGAVSWSRVVWEFIRSLRSSRKFGIVQVVSRPSPRGDGILEGEYQQRPVSSPGPCVLTGM